MMCGPARRFIGARAERVRDLDIHVDDAVPFVGDTDLFHVEVTAASVLSLKIAGRFNIVIGGHVSRIPLR